MLDNLKEQDLFERMRGRGGWGQRESLRRGSLVGLVGREVRLAGSLEYREREKESTTCIFKRERKITSDTIDPMAKTTCELQQHCVLSFDN